MSDAKGKTKALSVRVTPETMDALSKVAGVTSRSVSGMVNHALHLYIATNYPDAFDPETTLKVSLEKAPIENGK